MVHKNTYYYHVFTFIFIQSIYFVYGYSGPKSSLTFVVDESSSMSSNFYYIQKALINVFNDVSKSKASYVEEYLLVTMNECSAIPDNVLVRTNSSTVFQNQLSKLGSTCGSEDIGKNIKVAIRESRKYSTIYAFTDMMETQTKYTDEILDLSQKMGSQINFVLIDCNYDVIKDTFYQPIAKSTFGEVFNIKGKEIDKLHQYILRNAQSRKDVITYRQFNISDTFIVRIDANTADLVISLTGKNPLIQVKDTKGNEIAINYLTYLEETKIVGIDNLSKSEYEISVQSTSPTAYVVVSAETSIMFDHGFSRLRPTAFEETILHPRIDCKWHVSIKVSTDTEFDLKSILIVSVDTEMVFAELSPQLVETSEPFYVTDAKLLPNETFKILIKGKSREGHDIVRRSLVPIIPETKVPVKIDIPRNKKRTVTVDSGFTLNCNAHGLPKPNISWTFTNSASKPKTMKPTDSKGNLKIKQARLDHKGIYTCTASNNITTDQISYEVFIEGPPTIKTASKDFTVVAGDTLVIPCEATGNPEPTITWLFKGFVLKKSKHFDFIGNDLVIKNLTENLRGDYLCQAKNKFASPDYKRFGIVLREYPDTTKDIFQQLKITVPEDKLTPLLIPCAVKNLDGTEILRWYKDDTLIWTGKLKLPYPTKNDYGNYYCRISTPTRTETGVTVVG